MDQSEIRKNIISIRKNLTSSEILSKSQAIYENLFSLPLINQHQTFMVYKSFKGEVDTNAIIDRLISMQKVVLFPAIIDNFMLAVKPTSNVFVKDKYGIETPLSYTNKDTPNVVITPIVACDVNKNRVGFGKGYYDKFFASTPCLKIGICYDFQIVNNLPVNEWDVPLDIIITEKRIIK